MICNRCTATFYGDRCDCGWSAPKNNEAAQAWTLFECAAPGCHVTIRERIGAHGPAVCRFCAARGVTLSDVTPLRPVEAAGPIMTREEFGEDLYECIKQFSCRDWLRKEYRRLVTDLRVPPEERKERLANLKRREADCTATITSLIGKVEPADAKRLLKRYESEDVA